MLKKIIFTAVVSGLIVLSGCSLKSSLTKDNIIENKVISNSTTTASTTKVLNNTIACTQEAKICPDGSAVVKSGPNCEFAACPVQRQATSTPTSLRSGIQGTITLGPVCPVQHMPPDPNCADKPYQATVIVKNAAGQEITHFTSAQDGSFKVNLSPGTYLLQPFNNGGTNFPIGRPQPVTVSLNKFTEANLMFDTGIR